MFSHVYKSLIRRPIMNSMPTKWLVFNLVGWVLISIFLAVKLFPYMAISGIFGFLISNYFLQKAFLKDPQLFSVYWKHFFQEDYYPAHSRFNYKCTRKKW